MLILSLETDKATELEYRNSEKGRGYQLMHIVNLVRSNTMSKLALHQGGLLVSCFQEYPYNIKPDKVIKGRS